MSSAGAAPPSSSGGGGPGTPGPPAAPAVSATPNNTISTTTAVATTSTSSSSPTRMIHYRRFQRPQRRDASKTEDYGNKPICDKFVADIRQSDGFVMFTSPNYPDPYPNNTDCIRIIEADPGKTLRLDFREVFDVEGGEGCRFDYLEIRDGAHGFSKPIANVCGQTFPPVIQSSGRYLWLHFHSDETIEYRGFQAVYENAARDVPQPEMEQCQIFITGKSDGYVNRSDISTEVASEFRNNGYPLDCMWIIEVELGWKVQLSFLTFKLEKPNDCDANFVDIFDIRTDISSRIKLFCGSIADNVQSNSNKLHVRFFADATAQKSFFESSFTAFRDNKGERCQEGEYDCEDNTCINVTLKCNGRKNCRFGWDEEECKRGISSFWALMSSEHIIIIMIIFTLILSGMCFAFVFNCVKKLRRDHKIIQEHIRQSREGRLDEAGRISPSTDHVMTATAFDGDMSIGGDGSLEGSPHAIRSRSRSRPGDFCVGYGLPEWSPGGNVEDDTVHPILTPTAPNGEASFIRNEPAPCTLGAATRNSVIRGSSNLVSVPSIPEMRDSECQTRESLFQFKNNSGSAKNSQERSVTPPPPPPPSLAKLVNMKNSRNAPAFSTFGYGGSPVSNRGAAATLPSRRPDDTQCFRAEAVIEMDAKNGSSSSTQTGADGSNNQSGTRPYSVESSKSAPDVIVTH